MQSLVVQELGHLTKELVEVVFCLYWLILARRSKGPGGRDMQLLGTVIFSQKVSFMTRSQIFTGPPSFDNFDFTKAGIEFLNQDLTTPALASTS